VRKYPQCQKWYKSAQMVTISRQRPQSATSTGVQTTSKNAISHSPQSLSRTRKYTRPVMAFRCLSPKHFQMNQDHTQNNMIHLFQNSSFGNNAFPKKFLCVGKNRPTQRALDAGDSATISGSFHASAFFRSDGVPPSAPAPVTQTVRPTEQGRSSSLER